MVLNSDSEDIFMENCENLTTKWSKPVVDYFNKNIRDDIVKYSAKWTLKELNLFNPYSGITNNSSEGMNTVIKHLMKWKEVSLDTAVLCLSYLQNYYWNEILRGFCDLGNFSIRSDFSYLRINVEDAIFPRNIYRPDLIIDKCQERIKTLLRQSQVDSKPDVESLTHESESVEEKLNLTNHNECKENRPINSKYMTQYALAATVIEENRIIHVLKMSTFLVSGTNDDKYAVTLFPKEKCQCPASGNCYHILAAKMSIGKPIEEQKRNINLTQLARNKRKRADKNAGRKKPRRLDYEVTPAPDSKLAEISNMTNITETSHGNITTEYYN